MSDVLGTRLKDLMKNCDQEIFLISPDHIEPNPFQPRKTFDDKSQSELVLSIKNHGILQPLLIREYEHKKQLIAGERRLRAAKTLLFLTVPCLILDDISDKEMMELALIENIQRKNLHFLEEACAYLEMKKKLDITQETLAKNMGKSRSHIANLLRVAQLSENVQKIIKDNHISLSHAKIIASSKHPLNCVKNVIDQKLSVSQLQKDENNLPTLFSKKNNQDKNIQSFVKKFTPSDFHENLKTIEQEITYITGVKARVLFESEKSNGELRLSFKDPWSLYDFLKKFHIK